MVSNRPAWRAIHPRPQRRGFSRKTGKKSVDREQPRQEFYRQVPESPLTLAQSVRLMRRITGKTQPDFARLIGIAPRVLIDIERGVGNPTLNTLSKIGQAFGLVPGLVRPRVERDDGD